MIIKSENFSVKQIADSGQCFRMNQLEDEHTYSLVAYNRLLKLRQVDQETIELSCSKEEYDEIWEDYFDMSYDYNAIIEKVEDGDDEFLKKAVSYGRGIRILRQEPFEVLISFIISQNKNITSIKNCVEGICKKYGKLIEIDSNKNYYTFPSAEKLSKARQEDLRALKLGYRDEYIIEASKAVVNGDLDLDKLIKASHEETIVELKKIKGIGDKVANCISLFGLHHIEAFPIDVWIKRVLEDEYNNEFDLSKYEGYAGIIQQYMFYYKRSMDTK